MRKKSTRLAPATLRRVSDTPGSHAYEQVTLSDSASWANGSSALCSANECVTFLATDGFMRPCNSAADKSGILRRSERTW